MWLLVCTEKDVQTVASVFNAFRFFNWYITIKYICKKLQINKSRCIDL